MNRFNIVVIIFGTALLLFLFQNCQKPQLTEHEDLGSNGALSLPNLAFKYKNLRMNATSENQDCTLRCLTAGQIRLDLEQSKITFIGHWTVPTNLNAESASTNNTDIELNLSADELQNLRYEINLLSIIARTVPDCDNCENVASFPSVIHTLTDYNDFNKTVYLYDLVDPNIFDSTINVYDSTDALDGLVCKIKAKLQSTNLSSERKADLTEVIKLVTRADVNVVNCP